MSALALLLPLAALTGACWLFALLRAVSGGQYEDLEGAALRIFDEDEEASGLPSSGAREENCAQGKG